MCSTGTTNRLTPILTEVETMLVYSMGWDIHSIQWVLASYSQIHLQLQKKKPTNTIQRGGFQLIDRNLSLNFLFQQFNHSETNQRQEMMLLPASIEQELDTIPWVGSNGSNDFFLIPFDGEIQETELVEGVTYSTSHWSNLGNCVSIRCNSNDIYLHPFL